jgi:uncharacterized OB-fold protein
VSRAGAAEAPADPVRSFVSPIRLEYDYTPGRAMSAFLGEVAGGRLTGRACGSCGKVYVPSREVCPRCGVPTERDVDVSDRGTISTFCVVNLPFAGQAVECPYVCASVLLDGADTPVFHLIQEADPQEVRMGMRVQAVWADPAEREPTLGSIRYFKPTGEPDTPLRQIEGVPDA